MLSPLICDVRPELNRHGDTDVHHALPARVTGQHGIETNALVSAARSSAHYHAKQSEKERSLSNSSSLFAPSSVAPPHSAPPMALNGSGFGAASSLDEYEYYEKSEVPPMPPAHDPHSPPPVYLDHEEDYSNLPPAVQSHTGMSHGGAGVMYDSELEDQAYGGARMSQVQGHPAVSRF